MASVLELILRTKKQGTAAKDTTKELGILEKAAKSAALAFVAMGAAKVIKSSALLAARVETLGVVTKTLGATAGMTEDEIRSLERAITDQGITLQGSRQSIAMMIQANVDLAHATDLARLAQNTAVIANINSSEAFQQLTYVLQTGNVRMARTLGLNVQFGKAQQDLAKELGKTTAELSEQEIMQARTNAVMKAGIPIANVYEEAMGTAGKQILSMDRQIENLSLAFGELFLPAMTAATTGVYELASGINETLQALEDHRKEMTLGTNTYQEYYDEMIRLGGYVSPWTEELSFLTEAQWNLARAMDEGKGTIDGWNKVALTSAQLIEFFPELDIEVNTGSARGELETFDEYLTRWSRENKRKLQLDAVARVREEFWGGGEGGGEQRAGGGPVQAGKPYIVGEREAEMFVPKQDGHIYNQQQLAGGDININSGVSQRAFNNMAEDWMRGLGG